MVTPDWMSPTDPFAELTEALPLGARDADLNAARVDGEYVRESPEGESEVGFVNRSAW